MDDESGGYLTFRVSVPDTEIADEDETLEEFEYLVDRVATLIPFVNELHEHLRKLVDIVTAQSERIAILEQEKGKK